MKILKNFAKNILPPKLLSFVDFYFKICPKDAPFHLKDPSYGPLNGQIKRREIFQDICKNVLLNAIIETGTFRGSATEFFLEQTNIPVYSVEVIPRYYYYSYFRLRKYKNAHLFLGDSVSFLKSLQEKQKIPHKGIFFYLDAHGGVLPLRDEVDIIVNGFSELIILIDDFQVPDDPGYGFDDWGPGNKLCLEYLELHKRPNLTAFFPVARSSEETGARRGCIVLVTKDLMLERIKPLKTLRQLSGAA